MMESSNSRVNDLGIMSSPASTNDEEYVPGFVGSNTGISPNPLDYDALDAEV